MKAEPLVNIASAVTDMAARRPDAPAMVFLKDGRSSTLSFRGLEADCSLLASGLAASGVRRGMRAAVMIRPGPDFFAVTFALFRLGAVPVLIDPGLGRQAFGRCLEEAAPEVFVGIPLAHAARRLFRWAEGSLRLTFVAAPVGWPGTPTLGSVRALGSTAFPAAATAADEPAAVLFTSGSTGAPKGALYTHGNFAAQVELLRGRFGIEPGEVDLATFPLFGLFDPALGMTAVIPDMDFTRPGSVNPRNILDPVRDLKVTNLFGSPALLDKVSRAAEEDSILLPSLKRVLSAGAPVTPKVLRRVSAMLAGDAEVHTPYGATEALPVCAVGSREVLAETAADAAKGRGTCVGRPLPGVELRVMRIIDGPVAEWTDELSVPPGEVGEFLVRGPQVTGTYFERPEATALAKVRFPDGSIAHRMGDLGFLDHAGRAWFCGRKSQRVETVKGPLYTDKVEGIFNAHPAVRLAALVGVGPKGAQRPVVVIQPEGGHAGDAELRGRLLDLAAASPETDCLADILFHPSLPVDVRHNAKIQREALSLWAAARLA